MDRAAFKIVSLAIEVIDCSSKAVDASRHTIKVSSAGGYTSRDWAVDVLRRLPDDRDDARLIVQAHSPAEVDQVDRRRVNKLCREYYKLLSQTDLLVQGQRFLEKWA